MPLPIICGLVAIGIYLLMQIINSPRERRLKKTPPGEVKPAGKKVKPGLILRWILAILAVLAIVVALFTWYQHEENKRAELAARRTSMASSTVAEPRYEWSWKLPRGVYVRGRNESAPGEGEAEVTFRPNGDLWIDLHYNEYGSPETSRIRLQKVQDNSWEGTWSQENPKDAGRCTLNEVAPGVWTGQITGSSPHTAYCSLIRK